MVQKEKSMHQVDDLISELFKTIAESIYDIDMQHGGGKDYWPFHPVFLNSLVGPILFREFFRIFRRLEENGYTLTDIGNIIKSPTKIANYLCSWSNKVLKPLSYEEKYELIKYFLKLLIILRNGEPFCERKRNLVWSRKELQQNLKEYEKYFISVKESPEMAQLLSKLEALLLLYVEALYYYLLDFSRMMHGPYLLENKSTIFVKEYFHLKAGEMWDIVSDFPFDHFKEIGIYNNISITVFFLGHVHSNPPFPQAIEKFVIVVDDKVIKDERELKDLYEKVKEVTERAVSTIEKKSNDESFLLKKGIDMFFYPLKPLYEEIGENWKDILPEVYKFASKVKDKVRIPRPWGNWSKEKAVSHLLKSIDFRRQGK
ncbi:MAG: hypothetical protein QXI09_03650 [Candidatus Aenigmatarchaeota archaeon]